MASPLSPPPLPPPRPRLLRHVFSFLLGRKKPASAVWMATATSKNEKDKDKEWLNLTVMQRVHRILTVAPPIERLLLRSKLTEDVDMAHLLSKSVAISVYSVALITVLGTLGVDTKPLITGLGVTGFTIGFALKEIATNFISGVLLVIQKPFEKGSRLTIHGSGGGIEGFVESIDVRYVILRTETLAHVMIPSAIVYSNPITVLKAIEKNLHAASTPLVSPKSAVEPPNGPRSDTVK